MFIKINDIKINEIRRGYMPEEISLLSKDIAINGLKKPIIINSKNALIDGFKRIEAMKVLGQTHINAKVSYDEKDNG